MNAGDLASVTLSSDARIVREPIRPMEQRQPNFDERYDRNTIFFDGFIIGGGAKIRFVGPPFLNLDPYMRDARVRVLDPATGQDIAVQGMRFVEKKKVTLLTVRLARRIDEAVCELDLGDLGQFRVVVKQAPTEVFAGKRVLFTLFKYEPLEWLYDWAEFHIRYHGVNALVVNHNDCPHATTEEIMSVLEPLEGLDVLTVVEWSFPYGPAPHNESGWDSTYCQVGLFAQLRDKYFTDAEGVLNADIDELIITEDHLSVFDLLANDPIGYIRISGCWISSNKVGPNHTPYAERRHRHYAYVSDSEIDDFNSKWAIRPSAIPPKHQWRTHAITDYRSSKDLRRQTMLCHFRDINTNWKEPREVSGRDPVEYQLLAEAYRRVGWR